VRRDTQIRTLLLGKATLPLAQLTESIALSITILTLGMPSRAAHPSSPTVQQLKGKKRAQEARR
jgi:hypothetical protein